PNATGWFSAYGVPLDFGSNDMTAVATDIAGNPSAHSNILEIVFDDDPPYANITINPASPVSVGFLNITLVGSEPLWDVTLNYTSQTGNHFIVNLTDGQGEIYFHGNTTVTESTGDGTAVFHYTGHDLASNKGTTILSGGTFFIDTQKPFISIDDVTTPTTYPTQVITGTYSDPSPSSGIDYISVNGVLETYEWGGGAYSHTVSLVPGNNTINVTIVDKAGNIRSNYTYIYYYLENATIADAGPDQVVPELTQVQLDGTNSSTPYSPLSYEWYFLDIPASSSLTNSSIVNRFTSLPYFVPDVVGDFLIELYVEDAYGSGDKDNVTITAYAVPPVITIILPENATYFGADLELNVSFSEPIDFAWYSLNGADDVALCTSGTHCKTSITADLGVNYITVWANDSWNEVGSTERWFSTSCIAPNITLYTPANGNTLGTNNISFGFIAEDDIDPVLTCNLYIDNQTRQTNNSVISGVFTYFHETDLIQGAHYWDIECWDGLGSANSSNGPYWFTIDLNAPVVTIIKPKQGQRFVIQNDINLTFNVTDAVDPVLDCYMSLDGTLSYIGPVENGATHSLIMSDLSYDSHIVYVECLNDVPLAGDSEQILFYINPLIIDVDMKQKTMDTSPSFYVETSAIANCSYNVDTHADWVPFTRSVNDTGAYLHNTSMPEQSIIYTAIEGGHYKYIQHHDYWDGNHTLYVRCESSGYSNETNLDFQVIPPNRDKVFYQNEDVIEIYLDLEEAWLSVSADFSSIDSGYSEGDENVVFDTNFGASPTAHHYYNITYTLSDSNTKPEGQYRVFVVARNSTNDIVVNNSIYLHYHYNNTWETADVQDAFVCWNYVPGWYFDEAACDWESDVNQMADRRDGYT
ncbi:hypothetical protein DRO38_05360, partial [Candidatus Bathyarchaeota archaeon]